MILTRSPYYFEVAHPVANVTSVQFTVVISAGGTDITTYNYVKQKAIEARSYIDISPIINDIHVHTPLVFTDVDEAVVLASPLREVLSANVTARFNTTTNTALTPVNQVFIAVDGYSLFAEGVNFNPSKKILLSHDDYIADNRGYFLVPLQCSSGDGNPVVDGVEVSLNFVEGTTNAVKYLVIPCNDYVGNVLIEFGGESINIDVVDECRYPIQEVMFANRFGVLEIMHFRKSKKESYESTFERFTDSYSDGAVGYSTSSHQFKRIDLLGKTNFTMQTGFLNESYNATIKELINSDSVWLNGLPVNVTADTLELKTGSVDGPVNYEIRFEYSNNEINNM